MYELIPEELKKLPNWVVWKAKPDPKSHSGVSKIPINPKTGGQAQSNNPETWTDFETAESCRQIPFAVPYVCPAFPDAKWFVSSNCPDSRFLHHLRATI